MRNILIILVSLNVFCCNAQRYFHNRFEESYMKRDNNIFLNFKDADSLMSKTVYSINKEGVKDHLDTSQRGEDCNINEERKDFSIINGTTSVKDRHEKDRKYDLLFFSTASAGNAPPIKPEKKHTIIIYKDKKQMKINLNIFHYSAHRGIGY